MFLLYYIHSDMFIINPSSNIQSHHNVLSVAKGLNTYIQYYLTIKKRLSDGNINYFLLVWSVKMKIKNCLLRGKQISQWDKVTSRISSEHIFFMYTVLYSVLNSLERDRQNIIYRQLSMTHKLLSVTRKNSFKKRKFQNF